eukprot:CAMPEP_0184866394 /NCGR_PEP_ID=MMETSP0580-20130426/22173_1 /TAXON_ID=1118495 /ORGANISM="Dactyliosolen fragilissimus" /LENGTH=37 /DNA_ID= /DNA_START= /DNA_END= /DNA_ORIENTATION=
MIYRFCAAMQQMRCGSTDAGTLTGFSDIASIWDTAKR